MKVQQSKSKSSHARAHYARARNARRTLDFTSTLVWGGGMLTALLAVAIAGFYLPALARLGLVFVAAFGAKNMDRMVEEGPELALLRPVAAATLIWLGMAWGLGLIEPFVAAGFVGLVAFCGWAWWRYGALIDDVEGPVVEEPARELSPDERLDQLLRDAPLDGMATEDIVATMEGHMSRATVSARLKEWLADGRAWKVKHGRWRSRPTGAPSEVERP